MPNHDKKGVILFIVIGIIMVVVILCTVILRVIANQSRLTHHQVSRIQAQYVAKAGMVYALEMLRTGAWNYSVSPAVNSCPNPAGCLVTDVNFPSSVVGQQAKVIFCPAWSSCGASLKYCNPPVGNNFCIDSIVDFVYTP